jgi:cytochrome c-type biogenesis protein
MSDVALATDLTFALSAGVATFFSPCAYPLLPGYVGFYINQADVDEISLRGAGTRGVVAGLGVLLTFGALTGGAVTVGHSTLSDLTIFESLVGALLVVFGVLVLFGRAPSISLPLPKRRASVLGFGVFGAGYALAGAGCAAPFFLGVIARALSLPVETAIVIVAAYAGIIALLMMSVTVATGMGLLSNASRLTAYSGRLKQLAGVVMIVAGVGQLYLALVIL